MLQTKIEERKNYTIDKNEANKLFEKYIKKLRITPTWDVQLEFVDDHNWKSLVILRLIVMIEKQ